MMMMMTIVSLVFLVLICISTGGTSAGGVHAQINRRMKIQARHRQSFLELAAQAMPGQCDPLVSIHGKQQVEQWISQSYKQNASVAEMCSSALDCKRLLHPLLSSSGQLVTQCLNDCSNNGQCLPGGRCQCKSTFTGPDCSITACPQNCSMHGQCVGGTCKCDPGYKGGYCQEVIKCPAPGGRQCSGNGKCAFGKCFCNPGFTGEECSRVAGCPQDCHNRGLCLYGECFCTKGWGGRSCNKPMLSSAKCPNSCSGRGTCKHGDCLCDRGYFGKDCSREYPCAKGGNGLPCSGRGSCEAGLCNCNAGYMGHTCSLAAVCPGNGTCNGNGMCLKGTCYCHQGWSGADCSQPMCPACVKSQGMCLDGRCVCLEGYYGKNCEKALPGVQRAPVDPNLSVNGKPLLFNQATLRAALGRGEPCLNGCSGTGVCFNGTCACIPGFGGRDCSVSLGSASCPNRCSYRGVCLFGSCRCQPGYSGLDCSVVDGFDPKTSVELLRQCPGACSGHGTCKKMEGGIRSCECDEGYGGPDCSQPVPCPKNCHGRGACRRGKCFCFPGFSGVDCSSVARCKNGCSGRGLCFLGKCFCQAFYAGDDCSKTPHCPSSCGEHGICRGNNVCACEVGWAGVSCSEKLTCERDCSGPTHGRCVATVNGTACVCNRKYTGRFCELDVMKCKHECKNGVCLNGKCACNTGYVGEDCSIRTNIGQSVMSTLADAVKKAEQANRTATPRFRQTGGGGGGGDGSNKNNNNDNDDDVARKARFAQASDGTCPSNCNNQGVCANGQCFCNPGRTGVDCGTTMTCPNDCSNNGICKYGQCWCGPNHVGDDCSLYTTAGRKFPPVMVTAIIASLTFFVGIVVGRKTLARSGLKFAQSLATEEPELRDPIT